jgi:four helix bundle protein
MQAEPTGKSGARTYEELRIWQKGMDLCEACYKFSAQLPRDERYGLASQIRRASVSIPSNIAEGFGRENRGSFAQHLRIAQGSLKELETQLKICQRVSLATAQDVTIVLSLTGDLGRMLRSFIRTLQGPISNGEPAIHEAPRTKHGGAHQ